MKKLTLLAVLTLICYMVNAQVQYNATTYHQFNTNYGYIQLGPMNQDYAHIYTDRSYFIFNKPVLSMYGDYGAYNTSDLVFKTQVKYNNPGTVRMVIKSFSGNVGIGCANPQVPLAVNGKIQATEIEIKTAPCSDYVFEKDYQLMKLSEVDKFVNAYKHLPEVPSASEFEKDGYCVGQMDDLLLRKVEELTLYLIELNKENQALKSRIELLEKSVN
jgi:hypothetical protein